MIKKADLVAENKRLKEALDEVRALNDARGVELDLVKSRLAFLELTPLTKQVEDAQLHARTLTSAMADIRSALDKTRAENEKLEKELTNIKYAVKNRLSVIIEGVTMVRESRLEELEKKVRAEYVVPDDQCDEDLDDDEECKCERKDRGHSTANFDRLKAAYSIYDALMNRAAQPGTTCINVSGVAWVRLAQHEQVVKSIDAVKQELEDSRKECNRLQNEIYRLQEDITDQERQEVLLEQVRQHYTERIDALRDRSLWERVFNLEDAD